MKALTERKENICRILKEGKQDLAIIGDPLSIYYLTGVHITPYERFYALFIDVENKEFKMAVPGVDKGCMKNVVNEYVYLDSEGPNDIIQSLIGDNKKIAVDEKYFSMSVGKYFEKDLSRVITDVGPHISELRMYKDELEIKHMKKAAEIVDEAIEYIRDEIKPGVKEKDISMMLFNFMRQYSGFITDEVIIYVQGGERSSDPHAVTSDYEFKYGDVVLMDFCACFNYYWSDITRCLFIGEIGNEKLAEIYDIVLEANLKAIDAVKPGIKAKEIDMVARNYIESKGYGEEFLHRTGHGLGLSVHEEPYITNVNELILKEGMTFTIEPGIYLPGIGGIRIEDDILVTKDGCEVLTSTSKKLEDSILEVSN